MAKHNVVRKKGVPNSCIYFNIINEPFGAVKVVSDVDGFGLIVEAWIGTVS